MKNYHKLKEENMEKRRVLIVGDYANGKTLFALRLIGDAGKCVEKSGGYDKVNCNLTVWSCVYNGVEYEITEVDDAIMPLRAFDLAVVLYDGTSVKSRMRVPFWLNVLDSIGSVESDKIRVIGNKSDLTNIAGDVSAKFDTRDVLMAVINF